MPSAAIGNLVQDAQGERRVEFYIERGYSITTGQPIPDEDW
jgi:hypothetical protein